MKINYVLIDWDGCLAQTLDIWLEVYKGVVNKRGIEVANDLDFVEKSFGKWEKGFENVGVKDSVQAYKEALDEVEDKMPHVKLYPNAKDLILKLKENGNKLALLTSSFRHLVIPALKNHGLEDYFDLVITNDETEVGKPDPWIINTAIKHLGADRDKTIIMGDSDNDVLAGKAAQIESVLYFPEHNRKFYREKFLLKDNPTYVIKDLLELLDIIS